MNTVKRCRVGQVVQYGLFLLFLGAGAVRGAESEGAKRVAWRVGRPIVTYYAGPTLDDRAAKQMAEGGFNLVWSGEGQLDVAARHGLRALLTDGLLNPSSLDEAEQREKLDALIERVSKHPALYAYYIIDEPSVGQFAALGRLVAYLRERDPAHLAYINLFPTYASNEQLGTEGDVVSAYLDYLGKYVDIVKPALISYDHYQFRLKDDSDQYFLNLAMVRRAAQEADVPFLNIVQACTWAPGVMRVPEPNEMRYLVYTTVAYGAQGISYYVYAHPGHEGSIVGLDGKPGPLYHALKVYNREFEAIARELGPVRSLGVYHTALKEPGCEGLAGEAVFRLEDSKSSAGARGFLLGFFGAEDKATHVVVVNLDYRAETRTTLVGPGVLEVFDASSGLWTGREKGQVELSFAPGGGKLVRVLEEPREKVFLFNGRDFEGWKLFVPDEGVDVRTVWSAREGVIHCSGSPNGYMRTEADYADYRLHVEWRWPGEPGNSGVMLHVSGPDKVWPQCIEAQLGWGYTGDFWFGVGVGRKGSRNEEPVRVPRKKSESENPAGQWNCYDIVCRGNSVKYFVNDVLQNEMDEMTVRSGKIALESEGSAIEFRNIYLEPL